MPLEVVVPDATTFLWSERLRCACETLSATAPEMMAAISLTATLETATQREVDRLADTARTLAEVHGLCVTVTLNGSGTQFTTRFYRCPGESQR